MGPSYSSPLEVSRMIGGPSASVHRAAWMPGDGTFAEDKRRNTDTEIQRHAIAWLSIVDQHEYGVSWDIASSLFRSRINRSDWKRAASAAHKSLGSLISRSFEEMRYATSLPGAPDGEYAILQFQTQFRNNGSAIETAALVREEGTWKIAGYSVNKTHHKIP
jgi:hypothetical protein